MGNLLIKGPLMGNLLGSKSRKKIIKASLQPYQDGDLLQIAVDRRFQENSVYGINDQSKIEEYKKQYREDILLESRQLRWSICIWIT